MEKRGTKKEVHQELLKRYHDLAKGDLKKLQAAFERLKDANPDEMGVEAFEWYYGLKKGALPVTYEVAGTFINRKAYLTQKVIERVEEMLKDPKWWKEKGKK